MPEGGLINIGELSKPATVLIEKIASAVGVLYEPRRIKREARAEAEAALIRAKSSMEINDLQQRALDRFLHQETRKQGNIEKITAGAAQDLPEDAKVEELDEDWVAHFFERCDNVSDAEMQSLWSRLLSGEATNPGTFSKRTVTLVSTLDKRDAQLFTTFCQFVWRFGPLTPLIFDSQHKIYEKEGINFDTLKHLDYLGLISFEALSGYARGGVPKSVLLFYFDRPILVELPKDEDNDFPFGHAIFTSAGVELAPICGAQPNDAFYEYVVKRWYDSNLVISSPRLPGMRR